MCQMEVIPRGCTLRQQSQFNSKSNRTEQKRHRTSTISHHVTFNPWRNGRTKLTKAYTYEEDRKNFLFPRNRMSQISKANGIESNAHKAKTDKYILKDFYFQHSISSLFMCFLSPWAHSLRAFREPCALIQPWQNNKVITRKNEIVVL